MANEPVPSAPPDDPNIWTLPAGTRLARVHGARFDPDEFNPTLADPHWSGGRFDATADDPYAYLYAGSDAECAIVETLLRDLPRQPGPRRGRFLPRKKIEGRLLSWLRTTGELALVRLATGEDFARLGQDDNWLVASPASEYGFTRRWGHALRRWAPSAAGFVWPSRHDPSKSAYVFFADRVPSGRSAFAHVTEGVALPPEVAALDRGPGLHLLQQVLARYRVTLGPGPHRP